MAPSTGAAGNANPSMFHTIQLSNPPRPELAQEAFQKAPANGAPKRITTPHACAECKRRKIRCDGRQPCGQCLGCRSPKPCYYDKHRQRVIPSRKYVHVSGFQAALCKSDQLLELSMPYHSRWRNVGVYSNGCIPIEKCSLCCLSRGKSL